MDEKTTTPQSQGAGQTGGMTTLDHSGRQQQGGGNIGGTPGQTKEPKTAATQAMEQAKAMARNIGDQARSAVGDPGATAQELARRAREQANVAGDALYRHGQRAGEYLSQNVNEYPLAALLIAGMIGYGLAYLIHSRWQGQIGQAHGD